MSLEQQEAARSRRQVLLVAGGTLVAVLLLVVAAVAVVRSDGDPPGAAAPPVPRPTAPPWMWGAEALPFAEGACLGFAPAGAPDRGTVALDAGHGGADPGTRTTVGGRWLGEAELALQVALRVRDLLVAQEGLRVVLTRSGAGMVAREGDRTPAGIKRDLEARIACANAANADVLVSVHLNAFRDPSAGGTETIYNPRRPFARKSRALAGRLQRALVAALGAPDRGVKRDDGQGSGALTREGARYGQLLLLGPPSPPYLRTPSAMPGALVEPLFLTSPEDARLLVEGAAQEAIAGALATAIARHVRAG